MHQYKEIQMKAEELMAAYGQACEDCGYFSGDSDAAEMSAKRNAARAALFTALTAQADALTSMELRKDAAYTERNNLVALLSKLFPAGNKRTAIEGWSEDWHGCVYIDLPTGQASWHYHDSQAYLFDHLPEYPGEWDGHTTAEKYARIASYQAGAQADRVKELEAENAQIRTLMNCYNLGGWTDSLALIKERDAIAAAERHKRMGNE
jgi:hypothetical protein